jgi:hypothetical protein
MGSTLNYHILSDSAAAAYLWDRLADWMNSTANRLG